MRDIPAFMSTLDHLIEDEGKHKELIAKYAGQVERVR
jgi:hypothetical protein